MMLEGEVITFLQDFDKEFVYRCHKGSLKVMSCPNFPGCELFVKFIELLSQLLARRHSVSSIHHDESPS